MHAFSRVFAKSMLVILVTAVPIAHAGEPAATANNVANGGYDVVAYFTQNAAVRGSGTHAVKHKGVDYYFSTAQHRKLFSSDPEKYLPEYDGYCAFAVAKHNAKVKPDPETFKLRDGKLFLFFNDFYEGQPTNTIVFWNSSESTLAAQAEDNWKTLRNQ